MAVPQLRPTPPDSSISSHQLTICVLNLLLFSVFSTHEQPFRDSCAVPVPCPWVVYQRPTHANSVTSESSRQQHPFYPRIKSSREVIFKIWWLRTSVLTYKSGGTHTNCWTCALHLVVSRSVFGGCLSRGDWEESGLWHSQGFMVQILYPGLFQIIGAINKGVL